MPEMQQTFGQFGEWLLIKVGEKKAALTIHRYLPFFIEIGKHWEVSPSYSELLTHFGAEGLRRVRLPMRWLEGARNIAPDAGAREGDSERRRIEATIASVSNGTPAAKALATYQDRLMKRVNAGKSTLRSVRLALRPAASLLLAADESGLILPDQATLGRYLLEVPGQKAAITGFVNFLNEKHGLGLVPMVDEKQVSNVRRKKLEEELMALAREGCEGADFKQQWLSVALAYFHGLPKRIGISLQDEKIVAHENGGLTIDWGGQKYWIPGVTTATLEST